MNNKHILLNRIQTPDGTIITSTNRHNFVTHRDKNGYMYAVDGGRAYQRIITDRSDYKNLVIYFEDPIEVVREYFTWGTYGKSGTSDLQQKLLRDLTNEHIQAIIETQKHLHPVVMETFQRELAYRNENPEHSIPEGDTDEPTNTHP